MIRVSEETERELRAANQAFVRLERRIGPARERLHAAIIAHKRDGAKVEEIEDIVTYRRGRVTAILDEARPCREEGQARHRPESKPHVPLAALFPPYFCAA